MAEKPALESEEPSSASLRPIARVETEFTDNGPVNRVATSGALSGEYSGLGDSARRFDEPTKRVDSDYSDGPRAQLKSPGSEWGPILGGPPSQREPKSPRDMGGAAPRTPREPVGQLMRAMRIGEGPVK